MGESDLRWESHSFGEDAFWPNRFGAVLALTLFNRFG